MSLTIKHCDLFRADAQTLVNTVNCVGIMGRGVALEFKRRFPIMFTDYALRCRRGEVRPGTAYLYVDPASGVRIVNLATKDHWRCGSKLEWIDAGLACLAAHAVEWEITSLALPPPGCGNGGLDWADVRPLVEKHLDGLGFPVTVRLSP
jgi:O-acetyl-ADP-ribose deacetylase (regulator of RNase III)